MSSLIGVGGGMEFLVATFLHWALDFISLLHVYLLSHPWYDLIVGISITISFPLERMPAFAGDTCHGIHFVSFNSRH